MLEDSLSQEEIIALARKVKDWRILDSDSLDPTTLVGTVQEISVSLGGSEYYNETYPFSDYVIGVKFGEASLGELKTMHYYIGSFEPDKDKDKAQLYHEANDLFKDAREQSEANHKEMQEVGLRTVRELILDD